jgi:hypothetical protein
MRHFDRSNFLVAAERSEAALGTFAYVRSMRKALSQQS